MHHGLMGGWTPLCVHLFVYHHYVCVYMFCMCIDFCYGIHFVNLCLYNKYVGIGIGLVFLRWCLGFGVCALGFAFLVLCFGVCALVYVCWCRCVGVSAFVMMHVHRFVCLQLTV